MIKEILPADNNLHTKINATFSRELFLEETSDSFRLELVECNRNYYSGSKQCKSLNGRKISAYLLIRL